MLSVCELKSEFILQAGCVEPSNDTKCNLKIDDVDYFKTIDLLFRQCSAILCILNYQYSENLSNKLVNKNTLNLTGVAVPLLHCILFKSSDS